MSNSGTSVRRLAAVMFTDMVGYSALSQKDEARALGLLKAQSELFEPILVLYGGRLVRTMGDGAFVEFGSALGACRAALDMQEAVRTRNSDLSDGERFQIRIGIHLGDVEAVNDDLLGHGVNIAARLEPIAEPGGICISEDVARQVRGKIAAEIVSIGRQRLKNIDEPLQAYRLVPLRPTGAAPGVSKEPSLAVLPLANLSGDPDNEYFGDGLTDELLSALSRVRTLRVVSRTSCFALKGSSKSARELGSVLGVDYILEGSVRRSGNRVRVGVQLVEIETDRPLWSERFDRDLEDIFEIQEEITQKIVDTLQIVLSEAEQGLIGSVPTRNLVAYQKYVLAQAGQTNPLEAVQLLEEAVGLDPGFAKAYALMSTFNLYAYRYRSSAEREHLALAKAYAQKALELEPELVEGYSALADVALAEHDYDRADEFFEKALRIDPRDFWSLYNYGRSHRERGNAARAVELFRRGAQVRPDDYNCTALSTDLLLELGDERGAEEASREAIARIERRLACCPSDHRAMYLGAQAYARLGRKEQALSMAEKALRLAPEDAGVHYNLSCLYCTQGDTERAIELLEKSYEKGFSHADWVLHDPELRDIQGDPRVQAIVEKMQTRIS